MCYSRALDARGVLHDACGGVSVWSVKSLFLDESILDMGAMPLLRTRATRTGRSSLACHGSAGGTVV